MTPNLMEAKQNPVRDILNYWHLLKTLSVLKNHAHFIVFPVNAYTTTVIKALFCLSPIFRFGGQHARGGGTHHRGRLQAAEGGLEHQFQTQSTA